MYQIPILGQSVAFYSTTEILGTFTNTEELELPSLEVIRHMVYEEVLEVRKVASLERIAKACGYRNNTPFYESEIQNASYSTLQRIHNGLASLVLHGANLQEALFPTLDTLRACVSLKVKAVKKEHKIVFDSKLARLLALPPYYLYSLNHRTAKYETLEQLVKAINDL
ncbi:hypothetical protein [Enterococcus faecium]|uniref:hypothetical protein n=1 Tax=Enterococcus TaxID=1350 RepID=UPI000DEAC68C|nr:hypothetical protein [Enterococcus faecium]EGP5050200.1 hypothetical protein [Enterococcus faecium]RBT27225.1 hypothetical protein EB01_02828 [Enterococcus faecium]